MTPTLRRYLTLALLVCVQTPSATQNQIASSLPSVPLGPDAPFTVAMNTATLEGGPVYVADTGPLGAGFRLINGGVRNLVNGGAHAATNAETQLLLVPNPKARILMTLAEGLYRVVAKRSAGIASVADLRGKRVAVPPDTSAHYFLVRTLAAAGLAESDVTLVNLPRGQMWSGVVKGMADAIVMWEPESQQTVEALGSDAVVFQDNRLYRELFNVYTTTDVLGDPRRRAELVTFMHALLVAVDQVKARPQAHFAIIAKTVGQPEDRVARSWEHHKFPAAIVPDLVDVMVEEERWVAGRQQREPRNRAALAALIDTSVLDEARRRVATR